ncbi:MAG: bifunctional riboflavin kinase/FAD synthetase, partial [Pirellulales bacterium]|nr:bifunctional riboflavin kinase/FAD synthetase [Pirellulales bacterium]
MTLIRNIAELPDEFRGGAVAVGNFDGVHLGHAKIVAQLIERAREFDGKAIVLTFDPHPVRLLRPAEAPPPLTWIDRKMELLAEIGVDSMIAYPTDRELLALSPEDFFQRFIVEALDARAMVEGPNFYFGHNRAGTIDTLRTLTGAAGKSLDIVEPVEHGGAFVSSSRVRQLIASGDVSTARQMLTEPYRIRGMVTHGAGRGATIGFPTANIDAIDTLLPAKGVYAGRAFLDGDTRPAAINIGPNPTFGEDAIKVETHVIDFEGELYHRPLEVDFWQRLRDIQPFDSVEAL